MKTPLIHQKNTLDIQDLHSNSLSLAEKKIITKAIHDYFKIRAGKHRLLADLLSGKRRDSNYLICTAYSTDYSIGSLCERVNYAYAKAHDYEFLSVVLPMDEISSIIHPKAHATWFKIHIILKVLEDINALRAKGIQYIMWIDADAVIVNHEISLSALVQRGGHRELIIAEDMTPCCLINAGVFLLRVSDWSRSLLEDVWSCNRFDSVFFFEQSALIKCLRSRGEGLEHVEPFHSYRQEHERKEPLLFARVAVLPHKEMNSNIFVSQEDLVTYAEPHTPRDEQRKEEEEEGSGAHTKGTDNRPFLYHAAGCKNKPDMLIAAISKYRPPPYEGLRFSELQKDLIGIHKFHLIRGPNGTFGRGKANDSSMKSAYRGDA